MISSQPSLDSERRQRPTLLFYCQHALGMGHFVRSGALAAALEQRFRVVLVNGGPRLRRYRWPRGVEVVDLTPLAFEPDRLLVALDSRWPLAEACRIRQDRMLDLFRSLRPDALLIELFPFGRKKFAPELLSLLEEARASRDRRPVVVSSVRDILVSRKRAQLEHDDWARTLAEHYFDAVLVHSDPNFARLEDSFRPHAPLRIPVYYTGFVRANSGDEPSAPVRRRGHVLVSAGGGAVGEPLLRAAVDAHALLWPRERIRMKIVAGPLLPDRIWRSLREATWRRRGLTMVRSVSDLSRELRTCAASVSQCGYNTSLEILAAGVPALVIPFASWQENEQMKRAARLQELGAVRVLDPRQLDAPRLAEEIPALLRFQPRRPRFDLDGVGTTAQLVELLVRRAGQIRLSG
jgi:predicted glycosyltransferase